MFASQNLTAGQLNALVKKIGGHEAALRVLRGELVVVESTRAWREEDGVIDFSVTSDSTTGKQWIPRLEGKGFRLSKHAKDALLSSDFKPTSGVTIEVAVLKGVIFEDGERVISKINAEATYRGLEELNAEVACLSREKFTDKELEAMGLWSLVVMHEPIEDSVGAPILLGSSRNGGGLRLNARYGGPGAGWNHGDGFAFRRPAS